MSTHHALSRRQILQLAGAAVGASAIPRSAAATRFSMPGLYPGKVVGVYHSASSVNGRYQTGPIQQIVQRGITELTGAPNYALGWKKLFQPGDVVGIKVNPNGINISSQACLMEIIRGVLLAGVAPNDIVVYERYQDLLNVVKPWLPSWVRTSWASPAYTDDQTGISGYDPGYYVDLPQYLLPWQDPTNPSHTRSHVALFVTQQVSKIISLACLKDHQAAGVTLSLKNLSHGCTNNVDRSHPDGNTNYIQNYIPAVVSLPVIRNKTVLSIIDGVWGLYDSGPTGVPQFLWENKTIYFATDVVAGDRIGWRAIDAQRQLAGMPPEELAGPDEYDGFQLRQPQHILAAGQMGLGEYRDDYINFRTVNIG